MKIPCLAVASLALLCGPVLHAQAETALVEPAQIIADTSLPAAQRDAQVLAARRYATFWSTSEPALARAALARNFTDRTLPAGRQQGLDGPLQASQVMRTAIPDLDCRIEQLLVAGDRVVVHLRFRGHFSGRFEQLQGHGQAVDFIATDIYRVVDGRIADNWHLEDNLTLLRQLGAIKG
ncbi:ester cyclase [Pseudomonas sp. GCEP-101]|uniref:ester cyclase n=1 Tax=Pseudomonas sp. GCEP-101 TaxID=2974552 RepID=UPI00223BAF13|nr:ester cyclase [Pseudomonas sp. GCEP-101]